MPGVTEAGRQARTLAPGKRRRADGCWPAAKAPQGARPARPDRARPARCARSADNRGPTAGRASPRFCGSTISSSLTSCPAWRPGLSQVSSAGETISSTSSAVARCIEEHHELLLSDVGAYLQTYGTRRRTPSRTAPSGRPVECRRRQTVGIEPGRAEPPALVNDFGPDTARPRVARVMLACAAKIPG
jgi:hypothetical protein